MQQSCPIVQPEQEWKKIKKLAIDNYPELEWEAEGYGNFEQFDFVRKVKQRRKNKVHNVWKRIYA